MVIYRHKFTYFGTNFTHIYYSDIKFFQLNRYSLVEDGNIAGHVLVFHENADILYFGFFGVIKQ